ncbi:MAG: ATP-binding protein [Gemmatimonadaceae bacterium]|nr:ATP-binding protein [Gemmatimonadaceae bacterium]
MTDRLSDPPRPAIPPLVWIAAAASAGWPLAQIGRPDGFGFVADGTAAGLKLAAEGAALWWASGSSALRPTARSALRLLGGVSLFSALQTCFIIVRIAGGPRIVPYAWERTWHVLSYVLAAIALIRLSQAGRTRRDTDRATRIALRLDLAIVTGGMGALSWILVTWPMAVAPPTPPSLPYLALTYGLASLFMIGALNVLIVHGAPLPSRRAFWWLVAGQAMYIPVTLMSQLESPGILDARFGTAVYFVGLVPTLCAAVLIRREASADGWTTDAAWWRALNPLSAVVPAGVGLFFAIVLARGPQSLVAPLGLLLLALTMLLAARLLLTQRESHRLQAARLDEAQRLQSAKADAVGRLAGGIAHEFNNVLTTVIGHAEMGGQAASLDDDVREDFTKIRSAAERAARMTRRLLQYSGRQPDLREMIELPQVLSADHRLPPRDATRVRWSLPETPIPPVFADPEQVRGAVSELLENALAASPAEAMIGVSIAPVVLEAPLADAVLPASAGAYVRIAVEDAGPGIPPQILERAFDPFTSGGEVSGGLGLAVVYGVAQFHGAGLRVRSAAGDGTTIELLFPQDNAARHGRS